MLGALWLFALALLPTLALLGFVLVVRRLDQRDRRRSPLNVNFHHLPGEQLRRRIETLAEDIDGQVVGLALLGPMLTLGWLAFHLRGWQWSAIDFGLGDLIVLGVGVGWFALTARKMLHLRRQRRQAREGLAAELAVAQYLVSAAEEGFPVLHDLPGQGFNIDHVVIGRSAVFAIETKSRKKPEAKGKESARVIFDGERLQFPQHVETRPLDQTRAIARWLAEYLRGELGRPLRVVPVLALPGWFVEITRQGSNSDVIVHNCKVPQFVKWVRDGEQIDQELRNRIRFALVKRYEVGGVGVAYGWAASPE